MTVDELVAKLKELQDQGQGKNHVGLVTVHEGAKRSIAQCLSVRGIENHWQGYVELAPYTYKW